MSERNTLLLLKDIESSIIKILNYTAGFTFELYESDTKTREAVERNFEIIGEAAGRINDVYKQDNQMVEWRIIKDFRNFIIHEYFGIDNLIIWDTIQLRLPELLNKISVLVKQEE